MKRLTSMAMGMMLLNGIVLKAADAAKGKEVFEQCSVCHNADSDEKKMGPGLKGLFKKPTFADGKTKSGLPKTGALRRQPAMSCARKSAIIRNSVLLFPLPRMRAITALRLALVKMSGIGRHRNARAPHGLAGAELKVDDITTFKSAMYFPRHPLAAMVAYNRR